MAFSTIRSQVSWGEMSSDDDDDFMPSMRQMNDNDDLSDGDMDASELRNELKELKAEEEAAKQIDFAAAQSSWFQLTGSGALARKPGSSASSSSSNANFDPELDSSRHGVPLMFKSLFNSQGDVTKQTPKSSPKKTKTISDRSKSPWKGRLRSPLKQPGAVKHAREETGAKTPAVKKQKLNSGLAMEETPTTPESSTQQSPFTEEETARMERRQFQRQKQINLGKATAGYKEYIRKVPRNRRSKKHPQTPDKNEVCSKRCWDGRVRAWRRALHKWDLPNVNNDPHAWPQLNSELSMRTPSPTATKLTWRVGQHDPKKKNRRRNGRRKIMNSWNSPATKSVMTRSQAKMVDAPLQSLS